MTSECREARECAGTVGTERSILSRGSDVDASPTGRPRVQKPRDLRGLSPANRCRSDVLYFFGA